MSVLVSRKYCIKSAVIVKSPFNLCSPSHLWSGVFLGGQTVQYSGSLHCRLQAHILRERRLDREGDLEEIIMLEMWWPLITLRKEVLVQRENHSG